MGALTTMELILIGIFLLACASFASFIYSLIKKRSSMGIFLFATVLTGAAVVFMFFHEDTFQPRVTQTAAEETAEEIEEEETAEEESTAQEEEDEPSENEDDEKAEEKAPENTKNESRTLEDNKKAAEIKYERQIAEHIDEITFAFDLVDAEVKKLEGNESDANIQSLLNRLKEAVDVLGDHALITNPPAGYVSFDDQYMNGVWYLQEACQSMHTIISDYYYDYYENHLALELLWDNLYYAELHLQEAYDRSTVIFASPLAGLENLGTIEEIDLDGSYLQAHEIETPSKEERIQSLVANYQYHFVDAVNAGNYNIVAPYIYPGSNLQDAQESLISNLAEQGTKEELVEYVIEDIYEENGVTYVQVFEVHLIISSDGDVKEVENLWKYEVKSYDGGFRLADIEKP
ncbi:hypothetical protein [Thalassobacillus sp. C254]|uniref:TcaA NTF2-like domain-containing protein n=1 Tax=Thalassobacillus sp. C254 TaxID=1225341 RepID=UPI0012EE3F4F|nr:hypothetical protein [Thalassobacillus sp. C254]